MKKKSLAVAACLLTMAFGGVSLTACGSSEAEYTNLEEYFATDEGKREYDAIFDITQLSADGQEIKVEVSENTYTCIFTVSDVVMSELSEEEKQAIVNYVAGFFEDSTTTTDCQGIAKTLEETSGIDVVIYEMAFADSAGELIYSEEYTAE